VFLLNQVRKTGTENSISILNSLSKLGKVHGRNNSDVTEFHPFMLPLFPFQS